MPAFLTWLTRCLPGLSSILLIVLIECALRPLQTVWMQFEYPSFLLTTNNSVVAQLTFITYSLFLHVLALLFPLRLCLAARTATEEIQRAHSDTDSATATAPSDPSGGEQEWTRLDDVAGSDTHGQIIMAIILPSYKEEIAVLEDTLRVLASHRLAQSSYDVCLAMEARDPDGESTAKHLQTIFAGRFLDLRYTMHPGDIPGEAPGKSSNVSWAAKDVQRRYHDSAASKDVLVTVMDSDTHLLSQYFTQIQARHRKTSQSSDLADMTLYMPPIVFDRNAHLVPRLVRMADLMWCGAGLSCFQRKASQTTVSIPTSVYTLPLSVVQSVNGWDAGPSAIGEDMHMMLKCYFATQGQLNIECVPSPASQCNVSTDRGGIIGWVGNHKARYAQALRHMWGSLDTGYAIRQWYSLGKKLSQDPEGGERSGTRIENVLANRSRKPSHTEALSPRPSHQTLYGTTPGRFTWRNFVLTTRLFEAHFLPTHFIIIATASAFYTSLNTSISHCYYLSLFLDLTGYLRLASYVIMMTYFIIIYEEYHKTCVSVREREMRKAGLYDEFADDFARRGRLKLGSLIDYAIFPIAGTIYGSIPLLQATLSHFWGENLVYIVSAKPLKKWSKA